MSEKSFALGCVGLALAFGLVVPDPGKARQSPAAPGVVMVQPVSQPQQDKGIDRIGGEPFAAVHHAVPAKRDAAQAVFWTARATR